jgi:hypothetical protein
MVTPYHKSVLDWLAAEVPPSSEFAVSGVNGEELKWLPAAEVPSPELRISSKVGHELAGAACTTLLAERAESEESQGVAPPAMPGARAYALRHAVAHACQSGMPALVEQLLTNFQGLWGDAYAAGAPVLLTPASQGGSSHLVACLTGWIRTLHHLDARAGFGPSVVRDLSQHLKHVPQSCEALAKDVLRWLRCCSQGLMKHPRWVGGSLTWLPPVLQPVFAAATCALALFCVGA